MESSKDYYNNLRKLVRAINNDDKTIKFDEIGIKAFSQLMPQILEECGFSGVCLDVLKEFTSGLSRVYPALIDTPLSLSGEEFDRAARIYLGFQYITIFGTKAVTPSIKQIVVYTSFYVEKAKQDGDLLGVPLKLSNFSDGLMESAHKYAKQGTFLYSGGRHGATSSLEYQRLILSQLFHNELYRVSDHEKNHCRSSESKVTRKRKQTEGPEMFSKPLKIKPVGLLIKIFCVEIYLNGECPCCQLKQKVCVNMCNLIQASWVKLLKKLILQLSSFKSL